MRHAAPSASPVCLLPLPACRHLLPPPATSATAAQNGTMKRATCVGHSTMPRAQNRWLGAPFEASRLANQAATNVTCFRRRSKRPTKNPTQTMSAHALPTTCSRHGRLLGTTALWQGTGSDTCTLTRSPTTRRRRPALAPGAPSRSQRARSETKTIFGRHNGKAFDMLSWQMNHDAPRRHQICP